MQDEELQHLADLAEIKAELKYLRKDLDKIVHRLDKNVVTRIEYIPIQRLVYGLVAMVLGGVVATALTFLTAGYQ